jgi:hypothetical protein
VTVTLCVLPSTTVAGVILDLPHYSVTISDILGVIP